MSLLSGTDKARFVRGMFDAIASRYDVMNRLMTAGRDEAWRAATAGAVRPPDVRVALDLGAGTGDLSLALARVAPQATVVALDFSANMLQLGVAKARRKGLSGRVPPVLGDAMALPVARHAVDAIVTGFTLRNVADVPCVFRECYHALRPGGRLAVLELTPVRTPVFRDLFRLYFHGLVPLLGAIVSGRGEAYRYLPASVLRFPDASTLQQMLFQAGFARVTYRTLALGTVALHLATVPRASVR
ncbi:MAG TPA: ubiquinone/menaquinone biosynthesis methyltransferase [Chloroflexota bacterium]|nr:ubiquinone/menaquinone biosynthesis methyltransferase [Chloroflexota bacterium]